MTEYEMSGWHHRLDGHEFGLALVVGDGQGGLACCDSWGHKESDMTERLSSTETMVEVMKIMMTSFKRPNACPGTLTVPNPAAGPHPSMPPLKTPGLSQASLVQSLVGSLLLSPGSWCTQGSVCVLAESFSQSCVRSGSSIVGLMETSSKSAYALPKWAAPRAPVPVAVHC